jgi:spore maturation protein CgeB
MAQKGWCPSGRLFEAAACGVPIVTDVWPGLDSFFEPGREILLAHETEDVVAALKLPAAELDNIRSRARQRVLDEHTSAKRAAELDRILAEASQERVGEQMKEAV